MPLEGLMVVCQNKTSCWCMIITVPKNQIYTENKEEQDGICASLEFEFTEQEINREQTTMHSGCHFPLGTRLARYLKARKSRKRK